MIFRPKACNFIEKGSLVHMFSCEFCEISKNTFFTEHLRVTASGYFYPMGKILDKHLWNTEAVAQRCSLKKVFLEISQNSQENTCARVPFLTNLQTSGLQLY